MRLAGLQTSGIPALSTRYVVAAQLLICKSYSLENGELLAITRQPSLLFLSMYSCTTGLLGCTEKSTGFVRVSPLFMRKLVGIMTC